LFSAAAMYRVIELQEETTADNIDDQSIKLSKPQTPVSGF